MKLILYAALLSTTITLMSYNVKNCNGNDKFRDISRISKVIVSKAPHFVAIQEIDSCTNRSNKENVMKELAELSGYQYLFASAIEYDEGKYGIGLLSKTKALAYKKVALPGSEEKRTLLIAKFQDFYIACTHLSLTEEDRLASLDIIVEEASKLDKPLYIAGDFNDTPDSQFIKEFSKHFTILSDTEEFTFPSYNPNRVLDYIAQFKKTSRPIKKVRNYVIQETIASDHLPIMVKFSQN